MSIRVCLTSNLLCSTFTPFLKSLCRFTYGLHAVTLSQVQSLLSLLQVHLVSNVTFDLGYLEYEQSTTPFPLAVQIGVGVVVALCLIIIFIVIIVLIRVKISSSKKSRVNANLLKELSILERSVREQCKRGDHHHQLMIL